MNAVKLNQNPTVDIAETAFFAFITVSALYLFQSVELSLNKRELAAIIEIEICSHLSFNYAYQFRKNV